MPTEVQLLLVEDDEIDVMGIKRTLKKMRIANTVHVAEDGIVALEMLRGENGRPKLELPYIIMLDLNMPRMGGLELLEILREDPDLRKAIVFVMTTSSDERDIFKAYEKNIAGYIVKENAEETFVKALDMIDHYWRLIEFPME